MLNIVIIGGGQGGTALIEHLHNASNSKIIGVADLQKDAPGISMAKRLKIPTTNNYKKFLSLPDLDFIIDVTGNKKVLQDLRKHSRPDVEVISGPTAKFMWEQIVERVKRKASTEQLLFQYQLIYDLGLKLTGSQSLSRLLFHIVEDATKLTRTPAGSVALFDEGRGQMYLGAVKGFSEQFTKNLRWTLRKKGLTHSILNHKEPLVIEDVYQHPQFDNPIMLKEGIRSLMASPLVADGKIIGILYVNDFKARKFTTREASLLSLTSSIAATTIEKARSLEAAMLLAITDELTGLFNHRYFVQRLSQEINRAARYHHRLSLAMIDIDDFKQYNDRYGHLMGNELLRKLSSILKEHFRDGDVVARFGGEEFAIIMPETLPKKAYAATDRLRKKIADTPFAGSRKQPGKNVTISIGIAAYPINAPEANTLIERADTALYKAKRSGKNRVTLSTFQEKT
jgi:diguanylate cyclase (GGDEF)-like protein